VTGYCVEAPDGIGEITVGCDLAQVCRTHFGDLSDGDIVVVTSKIISKADGRVVDGDRAQHVEAESFGVLARRGQTVIARTRQGVVQAAAGVDSSNVAPGMSVLLPIDPDASARRLRAALAEVANVGVVITDTAGRAWRLGQTDIAVGAAGVIVLDDHAGRLDSYGNPLVVTAPSPADEIASAADLARGKTAQRPLARIRGLAHLVLSPGNHGDGAAALVRPIEQDMFALGTREAVLAAVRHEQWAAFGHPASLDELTAALCDLGATVEGLSVDGLDPALLAVVAFAHGWQATGTTLQPPRVEPGALPIG